MFAYCYNNPLRYTDFFGNYPTNFYYYDSPAAEGGAKLGEWLYGFITTDPNEKDSQGNYTPEANVKHTIISLFKSIGTSFGIGLGHYAEVEALDVDLALGIYYNLFNLEIVGGSARINQTYFSGIDAGLGPFRVGSSETTTRPFNGPDSNYNQSGPYYDEKINLLGVSGYFFAGISFSLYFDIEQFLNEIAR